MKKLVLICPYFGKIPEIQMNLWLKTCSFNKSIDFIILTNDKNKFVCSDNVKIIYIV